MHKSGSVTPTWRWALSAGHCGQGQRINQGSFSLICIRRLEEATSLPFLISFRSLSYNFQWPFSQLSFMSITAYYGYVFIAYSLCVLHNVGLLSHSFRGSGSGFLTMSLQLIFNDTLAYASVLECSESQRLHNETRYGHGGEGGVERSIQSAILHPSRPSHASHELKGGVVFKWAGTGMDWVTENSM